MPTRRHVRGAPPGFREHLFTDQQPQFDTDTGESNALPAHFGAGGDVVVLPHCLSLHAGSIVRDGERPLYGISRHRDPAGPGVQRIGDDLGEDGLFEAPGVRISQVIQQMFEVNARLAHAPPPEVYRRDEGL